MSTDQEQKSEILSSYDKEIFIKQRGTVFLEDGKTLYPEQNFFEQDLNYQFTFDNSKYLGEFQCEYYHLSRKYLNTLGNRKNLKLYYTYAKPVKQIKANFLLIHGFGEHSSRYMELLDYLAVNNYAVHMIDLSGFGQSGGARGDSTMEELHCDIELIMKLMDPELPLFLFGHSMGGGLISTLLMQNQNLQIAGFLCSSALLGYPNNKSFPWILRKVFQYSGPLLDDVVVNSYINPSALSKNNYHIKKMIEDRLVSPFLSLKAAKSMFAMLDYILPHSHNMHYPLFVLHGKSDIVTNPNDSINFFKHSSSTDKTIKLIQHAYHEPIHDAEISEYKLNILNFLESRYATAKKFGKLRGNLKKGIPSHTRRNIILLSMIIILLKLIKSLQLFTNILPVRHIMMRIFKHSI